MGPAIGAEHANYGASRAGVLRHILKEPLTSDFVMDEVTYTRGLCVSLSNMFCDHRLFTHGLRT